jgi:diadenosine tetraphosphatase ApaH/serine/threonine PP2A family protein phosphatase
MKVLVNVGSVGQPRDDNPKAAFAIYDSEEKVIEIKRVSYEVEEAARKIREAGLPEVLGERLKYGK